MCGLDRGELWSPAPGIVGMRGAVLETFHRVQRAVARLALRETREEWRPPPAIALETLGRAEYFSSFPQWLTVASHLRDDTDALEWVARAPDPRTAVAEAQAPPAAALPPAVCYHVYDALRGTSVDDGGRVLTAEGTCWRHEGSAMRTLERGWAFTMREVVCLGGRDTVEAFRQRLLERALKLAGALGLEARVEEATDPFFAPTARGKALLQNVKGLKRELLLPVGEGRWTAAASFNHHETFFGDAFGIGLASGGPAHTGCAAFGLERWLLAVLVARGEAPGADGNPERRDPPTRGGTDPLDEEAA